VDDPSDDEGCEPPSDSVIERVGDDERGPVKKLLLFADVKLNFDGVRGYLGLSVAARSDNDRRGGCGWSAVVWPVAGFGIDPLGVGALELIACMNAASILFDEFGLDPGLGILKLAPVGSSRSGASRSTSLTNTARICCGRSLAMAAYSSRSCSPVSPMRRNRESGKLLRMSRIPARLRVAGADRRPLKRERPA
jgi:hypothetical protein